MSVFRCISGQGGAPYHTGVAGSRIPVFDFCLVTTLGWTKVYTGTNKAVYKQPAGTTEFYLRVDDSAATTVAIRGYETMSDVDTGTGAFPTTVQVAAPGQSITASNSATSANRAWKFYSNGKHFVMFITNTDAVDTTYSTHLILFGTPNTRKASSDPYCCHILAGTTPAVGALNSATANFYMPRAYAGLGTAVNAGLFSLGANTFIGSGPTAIPDPISLKLNIEPVWISDVAAAAKRAHLPGLWSIIHPVGTINSMDTFNGEGTLAGRTFEVVRTGSAMYAMETSNTW